MAIGDVTSPETEAIVTKVMDAAFKVHRALGPGLLESVYEGCLFHELTQMSVQARRQVRLPIRYGDFTLESGLILDLLVEDQVVVELKAVDELTPLFEAQLLTYLRLSGKKVGLLINFNVERLRDGIKRRVS